MSFTATYIQAMREMGHEPFECVVQGCVHVSRSTFGQMAHYFFGNHQ